ncbi:Probable amino acid permease 7 [Linum perenne]
MGWYMVAFGVLELLMSQIPNFHDIQWLSNVAAVMSFAYSFIGFGLGFSRVLGNGEVKGTITGIRAKNGMDKMWKVSQALGDIAFAYPYSLILIEIQDTLKSPPSETVTMKKASTAAIIMTTFFYLCCSGFGYAAFGEDTPGNLLTGFHQPFWLINFAHVCIIFHLLGGYQVYSQPIFANAEKWFSRAYPDNVLVRQESSTYRLKVPAAENRYMEVNLMRLFFRTVYVATTTGIAMMFPYFNEVIGVLGGFMYWPVSIYFPVEMYLRQRDVEAWTIKWALLRIFSVVCLFLICFALVGSVRGLVVAHSG